MAVVRGHFATIIHPGLRQIWAGVYFVPKGTLLVPLAVYSGPVMVYSGSMILDDVYLCWPDSDDFDDYDDYDVARAEFMYDALY